MFKASIFISHFLDLQKEQEEMAKNGIFLETNFLTISPFAFTLRRSSF